MTGMNVYGQNIADDWADLTDAELNLEIKVDEEGEDYTESIGCDPIGIGIGAGGVWTNTTTGGTGGGGGTCSDWTSGSDGQSAVIARYCFVTDAWTKPSIVTTTRKCSSKSSLYCFQQ